nr:MAG TPA: hypothetical protein [Caudoviricetes sp.]
MNSPLNKKIPALLLLGGRTAQRFNPKLLRFGKFSIPQPQMFYKHF